MGKVLKSMKFDEELWDRASQAAVQTRRSTTSYIECATEEQIKRDVKEGTIKVK